VRLVLQTVDDAIRSDRQHRRPTYLLDCRVAEHRLDGLVPSFDVLFVSDDIEEYSCSLLIEEDVLGGFALVKSRVLDRLAYCDARVPSDLRTLILEPIEQRTSNSIDKVRLLRLVIQVDLLLEVADVYLG